MRKLSGAVLAARPLNCLITFVSIWAAGFIAGADLSSIRIMLAALSGALIAGFGNVINDVYDIEVDRLNKPYRPLIARNVSRPFAILVALILATAGIVISLFVHRYAAAIALPAVILLWSYTPFFKGISYLGNIIVAVLGAAVFIYGGLVAGNLFGAAILAIFAFLLHLGREIIKDIQDYTADAAAGYRTGAAYADARVSRIAASAVLLALVIATLLPTLTGTYGLGYFIVIIVGADFILVAAVYNLIVSGRPEKMRRISAWLKLAMPFGLLAVLLGRMGF